MNNELGIIVMDNCSEFGNQVNENLKKINDSKTDYIIPLEQVRFNNGEGKVVIKKSIRAKSVFILTDVGNHNCTYKMFDYDNHMSPDDHLQDIKRVISAMGGNAAKITVIMPLLYSSRQHKRKGRESLDCAIALQELERLGIKNIVTFDAHDPNVLNAIPLLSFDNFYPTYMMIDNFIANEQIDLRNLLIVAPDTGAFDRARHYADMLQSDIGMFYKRRDLSVVVDGKNPIVAHEYLGKDVMDKDVIIVDDMVASGDSILEVAKELKKRGANKIYAFATFAFFTKGIESFDEAHENGLITKFYTTNLSYISKSISDKTWFVKVDCAPFVAEIIDALHKQQSISPLLNGKEKLIWKVNEKLNETE
jgi:ribose-phosphate pyrophosphokinase